jgi:tetratricopeptide (TPR) repeat protein
MGSKRKKTRTTELSQATDWKLVALGCLIALATLIAYYPALDGKYIWDDNAHVTKPELRNADGLYHIWFTLGATQQYYPLLHSAFWLEYQLWGDNTRCYHVTNLILHLVAALLLYRVLRKLNIPGALLAAGIFALHPVHVESVAWISELKNTLSAIFYLSAMYVYLRFDETRDRKFYAAAIALFILGLLTKTVTATLPAALLVIFWWQRGRISIKNDFVPLIPFFAMGAVAGLFTAWVERTMIGADGALFADLTPYHRLLIAGRVPWFYLSKLLFPTNLIFIYPRWQVDPADWTQWLFPVATLTTLLALLAYSLRNRAPLACALLFVGTLVPVLGFLNVYPFIYSFVADHFQYLASIAVIVPVAAAVALLAQRWRTAGIGAGVAILAVLFVLTRLQTPMYADLKTLYLTTLQRNPTCWLAALNLGTVLQNENEIAQATVMFERALELNPRCAEAHSNLGIILFTEGKHDEGMQHLLTAVELQPTSADNFLDLANAQVILGQPAEAVKNCQTAVALAPRYAFARYSLGVALWRNKQYDQALTVTEAALKLATQYNQPQEEILKALNRYRRAIQN